MASQFERYKEASHFLESLGNLQGPNYMNSSGKFDRSIMIRRMQYFLDVLGNPELSIPNFVHVGGTAGKGSVTTKMANVLRASGESVGLYVSPHMTTVAERIWVDGKLISAKDYSDMVEEIKPALLKTLKDSPHGFPSYFELNVALGLYYFAKKKVDWAVLEVGCGGEFDATNAIPAPRAAIVTNVGLDHVNILGKTKREIAQAKAGIFKVGSTAYTMDRSAFVRRILKNRADQLGIPFVAVKGWNDKLVTRVAKDLGIEDKYIKKGIEQAILPARFEIITEKPLTILDAAHNADKIAYLIRQLKENKIKKPHVIFGCKSTKDYKAMLRELLPVVGSISFVVVQNGHGRYINPGEMMTFAKQIKRDIKADIYFSTKEAYDAAVKKGKKKILVTGSFYTVTNLRERWYSEAEIMKKRKVKW